MTADETTVIAAAVQAGGGNATLTVAFGRARHRGGRQEHVTHTRPAATV